MDNTPQILEQQNPRLSIKEAERIVDNLLFIHNISFSLKAKYNQTIIKKGKDKEEKIKYSNLINQVRKRGVCDFLQYDLDWKDPVFGGSLGISTAMHQMKIKTEWAGYEKELSGPFRNIPSEIDLASDIEFYKEETCLESSDYNFDMCCRNYRGYLFSSIALIDSYINRHIILFNYNGRKSRKFLELKKSTNTEQRIELFIEDCCNFSFESLKKTIEWSDFKKLKALRNEIIHSLNPYMGIELKEVASNLNLSINGVGTLLKKLQEGQGKISLAFIEQIRTSPIVHFIQVTVRADGNHYKKRHINKINR